MALVLEELAGEGAANAGGWMGCDLEGSWADFAAGLAVDAPVSEENLDRLEAFYFERGRPAKIKVTPYEHPSLRRGLADRGFLLFQLDSVLVRATEALEWEVPGLRFIEVDPSDPGDIRTFRRTQMAGFHGGEGPQGMWPITERVPRNARSRTWLFELDGQLVGSGGLERYQDSGTLFGGCVVEAARGRGVQSAFIRDRVSTAHGMGLRSVNVGSEPGGPTERNALRAGFVPAFTNLGLRKGLSGNC